MQFYVIRVQTDSRLGKQARIDSNLGKVIFVAESSRTPRTGENTKHDEITVLTQNTGLQAQGSLND